MSVKMSLIQLKDDHILFSFFGTVEEERDYLKAQVETYANRKTNLGLREQGSYGMGIIQAQRC
jgi:hypothetical protein